MNESVCGAFMASCAGLQFGVAVQVTQRDAVPAFIFNYSLLFPFLGPILVTNRFSCRWLESTAVATTDASPRHCTSPSCTAVHSPLPRHEEHVALTHVALTHVLALTHRNLAIITSPIVLHPPRTLSTPPMHFLHLAFHCLSVLRLFCNCLIFFQSFFFAAES